MRPGGEEPVTDLDLGAIRARHKIAPAISIPRCDPCAKLWPCDAIRLLAEVERMQAQHAAALALHQADDPTAFGICCTTCVTEQWPCPTARALGAAEKPLPHRTLLDEDVT